MITVTTNMQEDIQQQIEIGISIQQIKQNLLAQGSNEIDIRNALDEIKFVKSANGGTISDNSKRFGLLFVVSVIMHFSLFANNGNVLLDLAIVTAVGIAIYYYK